MSKLFSDDFNRASDPLTTWAESKQPEPPRPPREPILCQISDCRRLNQAEIPRDWLKDASPRIWVCLYHYTLLAFEMIKKGQS